MYEDFDDMIRAEAWDRRLSRAEAESVMALQGITRETWGAADQPSTEVGDDD